MDFKGLITLLAVVVALLLSNENYKEVEGRRSLSKEEDLELQRQLKIFNKPPVKTIHTKIGDIFDCIDIYKQPAFDHPLLKNHKIQMKLDDYTQGENINKENSSVAKASTTFLERHNERCPSGTVPIRRTKKKDLVNAKYISKPTKQNHTYGVTPFIKHSISIEPFMEGITFFGGKAVINLKNPRVRSDQFSTAQIWLQNGPDSIEFGWMVNPPLFGDDRTRLFGYWTADGYKKTGCFNMLCSGFVQVHPSVALGDAIDLSSAYRGIQNTMVAMVYREGQSGNWWLILAEDVKVGYWPNELLTHLARTVSVIRYGGVAVGPPKKPTPPMGSGQFPGGMGQSAACYMRNMKVVDGRGVGYEFDPLRILQKQDSSVPRCYNLKFLGHYDPNVQLAMEFGGPGGMCP